MNTFRINPIIKNILYARGLSDENKMLEYLSPRPQLTYDPFLMKGMDEASDLIIRYAKENRKICVYGDYDSDGINSVTLMMCMLKELTDNVFYYIPSRFEEGYGLNIKAIDKIWEKGAELILTVDCGCVSYNEVDYIKKKDMAVIVTDHHNIDDMAPECIMLNPKQKDDAYPFAYLCGCGVAFKLAQAISRKTEFSKASMNNLLDLVGIATIGDIVPLVDENRTLVKYGMDRIKRQNRKSIKGLMKEISLDPGKIDSVNIAFAIVPHLNSCGRMATADIGVQLLLSEDENEIEKLSKELVHMNINRRNIQQDIYQKAIQYIDENQKEDLFILYDGGDAHEGITGIVAGKLKDEYYRPVAIVTETENPEILKGTARSIEGIDLYKLLKKYQNLFIKFGGHAGACGFSIKKSDVGILRNGLNGDMEKLVEENSDALKFKFFTEAVIDGDEVNLELAQQIKMMEPFGAGNEQPLFTITGIKVNNIICIGKERQFRKLKLTNKSKKIIDAVIFDEKLALQFDDYKDKTIDIVAEIGLNSWNGRTSVQVVVRGIL